MSFYEFIELEEKTPEQLQVNYLYKDGVQVFNAESGVVIMQWLVENMADDDAYQEQRVDKSRSDIFTGAIVKSWYK